MKAQLSLVSQHNESQYCTVFRNWSFSCFNKAEDQYSDSCLCFCILPVRFNTALHLTVNHYFITRTQMKCHMWAPTASMTAGEIILYWTIAGVRVWMWRVKLHLVCFIVCGGAHQPEFNSVWLFCLLYNKRLASFPVSFSRWKCAILSTFPQWLLTFISTRRVHEILIGFLS